VVSPGDRSPAGARADRHRLPGYAGRRRVAPGGLHRAGRLRELVGTGLADSFGMSVGWTVLVLFAVARGGIAEAALYNAAMLTGVVLSAPVTARLARRLNGRTLLRLTASTELALRVGVLGGLVAGVPSPAVAVGVGIMYVAAWAGFAAMRAEVAAADPRPRAMTRYALAVAAVEAAGTSLAAVLPVGAGGYPRGWLLATVLAVYGGSLLPTLRTARRARVAPAVPLRDRRAARRTRVRAVSPVTLALGGGVMLLASGPTLLAVPLATQLYDRRWVAGAALAFSLGCVFSSRLVDGVARLGLRTVPRWSLWGLAMLLGWTVAPVAPAALLGAQLLSGLALTAFEGDMDARVAERAPAYRVTTALAYSAATRAMGGAVAVRALPALVAAPAIGAASGTAALVVAAILAGWAAWSRWTTPAGRRRAGLPATPAPATRRAVLVATSA
jgi:hypothetical protein